jgi:hypothetical protein
MDYGFCNESVKDEPGVWTGVLDDEIWLVDSLLGAEIIERYESKQFALENGFGFGALC